MLIVIQNCAKIFLTYCFQILTTATLQEFLDFRCMFLTQQLPQMENSVSRTLLLIEPLYQLSSISLVSYMGNTSSITSRDYQTKFTKAITLLMRIMNYVKQRFMVSPFFQFYYGHFICKRYDFCSRGSNLNCMIYLFTDLFINLFVKMSSFKKTKCIYIFIFTFILHFLTYFKKNPWWCIIL